MRATILYQAGDVRVENIPDVAIKQPTDAVIRVTRACICGSDLWPYRDKPADGQGRNMGHEAIGVVEASLGESRDALVARVDAALYRAKHNGRDRVES